MLSLVLRSHISCLSKPCHLCNKRRFVWKCVFHFRTLKVFIPSMRWLQQLNKQLSSSLLFLPPFFFFFYLCPFKSIQALGKHLVLKAKGFQVQSGRKSERWMCAQMILQRNWDWWTAQSRKKNMSAREPRAVFEFSFLTQASKFSPKIPRFQNGHNAYIVGVLLGQYGK